MSVLKRMLHDWRIDLVLALLVISVIFIRPNFDTTGVYVKAVYEPALNYVPKGAIITAINGVQIENLDDYERVVSSLKPGDFVRVTYKIEKFPFIYETKSTDSPFIARDVDNETYIGLLVSPVQFSRLEFGLDLSGGTKIILKPEEEVDADQLENIVGILEQRLNVYGFKEIPINTLSDFSGNNYIKVELPSSITIDEIEDLLESKGVFEAKIGNQTVFTGSDITSICMTNANCVSRIIPARDGFLFQFSLTISKEAAERFANATKNLPEIQYGSECYLNESIVFYLDGKPLEGGDLRISCGLKGMAERSPMISGGGATRDEAKENMMKLKSMLQSNNLPVKLSIESVEVISPKLGQEFLKNILFVFILAIVGVDIVISLRYRSFKITLPIIFITLSEITITLGIATMLHWTFDLSAIAGLIASVGTGVDDQIVITDEVLSKSSSKNKEISLKEKMKRAFFIVFATFATSIAIMIPLTNAGAGVLKGFAITTIIAISVGVFITRPAYARMLEILSQ